VFGFCPVFFMKDTLFNKAMGAPNDEVVLENSSTFTSRHFT